MNILNVIKKAPSAREYGQIVTFVGADPHRFAMLIAIFREGPYRLTQRVFDPLHSIVQQHPELLNPHLPKLTKNLSTPGVPVAVKRNTLRLLQFVPIPKGLQGRLADICFACLKNKSEAIAVRAFSMTVLFNIGRYHPEITKELKILIEDMLPYSSPGIQSRGKKILKALA